MIIIDPTSKVSPLADIEDSSRGTKIVIGAGSVIDSFVKIKPAGGDGDLIIGNNATINSGTVLYTGNGILIGNHVAIAANCTFAPVNHEFVSKDTLITKQGFKPSRGGIVVGDDVWIGANCVVLDGAVLNSGCVIGAGSIVSGVIDAYSINYGNPLKLVGWRK